MLLDLDRDLMSYIFLVTVAVTDEQHDLCK